MGRKGMTDLAHSKDEKRYFYFSKVGDGILTVRFTIHKSLCFSFMNNNKPLSISVLGSGKGTNFQVIADTIHHGKLNAKIVCVISDVYDALILERARKLGIPAEYIDHAPFKTKLDGEAEIRVVERLHFYKTELIALAGYMRIIKSKLLEEFPARIINIHPSLLPAFPGLESWKQALEHGVKVTGCTVHFVDSGMDTGKIIIQKAVPVLDDDTPETLHARIQVQEHIAYLEAIRLISDSRREL